jgi:hypothetical protein
MVEARRRTIVKTITWRLIGILWTWIGAYLTGVHAGSLSLSGSALRFDCHIPSFHEDGDVLRL